MKHCRVYIIIYHRLRGLLCARAHFFVFKEKFMKSRGMKPIAVAAAAFFFVVALVWSVGEDAGSRVALIAIGWVLVAFGALKLVALFAPMNKKYSAAFIVLSCAADMALIAAALTLFFTQIGFGPAVENGGLFSDIFMVAVFVCLALAEAASVTCNLVDKIDRFGDEE